MLKNNIKVHIHNKTCAFKTCAIKIRSSYRLCHATQTQTVTVLSYKQNELHLTLTLKYYTTPQRAIKAGTIHLLALRK